MQNCSLCRFWSSFLRLVVRFYTNNIVRCVTLVLVLLYWGISLSGLMQLEVQLSADKLFLDDSPTKALLDLQKKYIFKESGLLFVFVNDPGDLKNDTRLGRLNQLVDAFETQNNSRGPTSTSFWMRNYMDFISLFQVTFFIT